MRTARWVSGAALLVLVAYVDLDIADVAPGVLTTDRPVAAAPGAPAPESPARLVLAATGDRPVPTPAESAARPAPASLAAALDPLVAAPALGPSVGVVVRDGATGQVLYAKDAAKARTPASATKLITAAAVASALPMSTTLDTAVVRGGPGEIVLVAGGDTLLAPGAGEPGAVPGRAGLADLADQVAARLTSGGAAATPAPTPEQAPTPANSPVRVVLDDARLAGPRIDPAWIPADVAIGYAGPVAPLGLTTYRPVPGGDVPLDPALGTARAFRDLLAARGVRVAAGVARGAAPAGAQRLGLVKSAPIGDQLALALAESDNTLTSALARVAAVRSGVAPTFPAVASWITDRAKALGVPTEGLVVADPSGLAPGSTASASTLAALLVMGARGTVRDLDRVYADLPTAGLVGTLSGRYLAGPARPGAGLVRAKTGTLTGVSSLAGTVVDADGRLLVFAVQADRVPADGTEEARDALDALAARLAQCGCR